MTRTGSFLTIGRGGPVSSLLLAVPVRRKNKGKPLLLAALWAALVLVLAAPALAQGTGPSETCQARIDELPPGTTCGEDGGYEYVEDGGGYFAPIEATASAPAGAPALPETGGPPAAPVAAPALILISGGVLLALRVARHG